MTEWAKAEDGCRLAWRRDGAQGAPPILFLNSIGTDHRLWDPQIAALAPHFDILRFDARGHGASDAPEGGYTLAQLAGDAAAVLDAAGVARAHLCGLSLGGAVAQRVALDRPARVDHLVLANTAARIGTVESWQARIDTVRADGLGAIADMAMTRFFGEAFREAHPEVVAAFRAMLLANPAGGYAASCAALRDADMREELGRIAAPTLAIAGSLDVSTTPDQLRALADAIPDAAFVELDAAHLSNVEQPAAFARALAEFLAPRA